MKYIKKISLLVQLLFYKRFKGGNGFLRQDRKSEKGLLSPRLHDPEIFVFHYSETARKQRQRTNEHDGLDG